jgi:hypothetical protein
MMQTQERSAPRYPRRNAAEDRAWRRLYRSACDPVAASEIVQHLQSDVEAKRFHLALYLRCRETLRKQAARQARISAIIRFVHRCCRAAVSGVAQALRSFAAGRDDRLRVRATQVPSPVRQTFAAIERAAEHAGVPQLRAYIGRIGADRPTLEGDEREYADALLLKLDHLLRDQPVDSTLVDPGSVVQLRPRPAQRDEQPQRLARNVA